MENFITINGSKAWMHTKEDLVAAREAAINMCDHSEEVIVRPISEFTDYNKKVDIISNDEVDRIMKSYGLTFTKHTETSTYGFVGGLFDDKSNPMATIFNKCFYTMSSMFPLNSDTLALIKALQFKYKNTF